MKKLTRHWYNIGFFVAIGTLIYLIFNYSNIELLRRLQLISFIAMLIHQFEEYGFPGGEPAIMNIVLQGSDKPDRYPLNQFSAMFTNVLFSYVIYLLPVIFPNIIWLGIAPMLMGIMQFGVHGIMTNIKMKSIYNPGLGAVVFIHIPVGIYYLWYIASNNIATGSDWTIGIIYTIIATVFILGFLTYVILANRNTKYVFDEVEMNRFNVKEKIAKKHIVIKSNSNKTPLAMIEILKERIKIE